MRTLDSSITPPEKTMEQNMKAVVMRAFSSSLAVSDTARPQAAAGQVLVRVKASGVNPLDLKIASGAADHAQVTLPAILGIDLAGIVDSVGEGVTGFAPGDEVWGMTGGVGKLQGSLAQYAAVDADLLARKPASIGMREAAALPLVFITAWGGLVDRARIRAGQKVLVHGGAGGVGHIAVQIARAFGAQAYATGSASQRAVIEGYGAVFIDYESSSVDDYVQQHTGGAGFDIVFDTVGGATLDASFRAAGRYHGHVVSALGWGTHSLAPLSFRGATYSGIFTLLPLLSGEGRANHGAIMAEAARLVDAGKIKVLLDDRHYGLHGVDQAHAAMRNRTARGKVVVEVA
jgi:NADPH:quinone reductase-like Zn-dependent oxidoreductase